MIACAATLAAAACRRNARDAGPEPGTEFYAVSTDEVSDVTFRTPDHTVHASRSARGVPFTLAVSGRNAAQPTECAAGTGFARWLDAVSRLPIVRAEPDGAAEPAGIWADLTLRDVGTLDPITVRLLVPAADNGAVLVSVAGRRYVADVSPSVLRTAEQGCAVLVARAPTR